MRRFPRGPLALLLTSVSVAACTVGPNYQRPEIALRPTYMESTPVGVTPSAAASSATDSQWWAQFRDPVLTDLVTNALQQNLNIAQAVARVSQARAGLHAADAALLPSGQITASGSKLQQSVDTPEGRLVSGIPGFQRDAQVYEGDLALSWEVDIFGGLRRDREMAIDEYQASRAGVAAARLAVAAQVAETYCRVALNCEMRNPTKSTALLCP